MEDISKNEDKVLPEGVKYSQMTKCESRGVLPAWAYVLEIGIGLYFFTLGDTGLWAGLFVIGHAAYRLANMKRLQAPCPRCQNVQHKMLRNGKPFKCKSCECSLSIYGDKLADLESNSADSPPVAPTVAVAVDKEKQREVNAQAVGSIIFIGLLVWFWIGGGWEYITEQGMTKVTNKVASDVVKQYEIAKRNGNRVDVCVHAGLVKAAYLQAKDEPNFQKWTAIEASDCAYLGKR